MSDYKLEFKLKQYTPLIHFQGRQKRATLRATELKPKLDRFLLKHRPALKSHAVKHPNGDISLDYKVDIVYMGENKIDYPKPYVKRGGEGYVSPYFSDGISIEHTEDVHVYVKSLCTKIYEAIKELFPLFLTFENFGTRQSKGFGSYHFAETSREEFEMLIRQHSNPVFTFSTNFNSGKQALKQIDVFYKHLKMGRREPYDRALLFQYMCSTYDIGWEKRYLKEKFPEIIHGEHEPIICQRPVDPNHYKYIRAVLGLAEHNEYRPEGGKKQIKIESVERDPDDPRKARYQRFKSPITFKIFEGHVYLIFDNSYEAILDKEFYFKLGGQKERLRTPSQFNLYKFLQFAEGKVPYFKELS